jgi:peptidyl-prolyl cis-trans isomerase C
MTSTPIRLAIVSIAVVCLAGCSTSPSETPSASPPASTSELNPTATSETIPLAASVNGEGITMEAFENELKRYEADHTAIGTDLATLEDYEHQVLQAMIDRRLLAQGAQAAGQAFDELEIMEKLAGLALEIGGQEALDAWMAANFYTLESLLAALEEDMLAAKMVEIIVSDLPTSMEQVHASHILVADPDTAEYLRQRISFGDDFATLAVEYSTDTSTGLSGGDLGWFPRGTLTMSEVEEVAFDLEPGEVSEVIESTLGFHIVKCVERGEHPLSPDALRRQHEQAILDWLNDQRDTVAIEILITH